MTDTWYVAVKKNSDPPIDGGMPMGAANGAPGPLDGSGKLPTSQVPGVAGSDPTALHQANNLSDLGSASTARTNLGLGTAATHPAGDFAVAAEPIAVTAQATANAAVGLAIVLGA